MFKKSLKKLGIIFTLSLTLLNPLLGTTTVFARDSDHAGAAYLETIISPSEHRISANINYQPTGNAWFGQDTKKSPEWIAEKISWTPESWKFTEALLNGDGNPTNAISQIPWLSKVSTGNYFSPSNTAKEFKELTKSYEDIGDGARNNLVLTFPGWAAADMVYKVNTGSNGIDRNADSTSDEFARIDSSNASTASGQVNDALVSELNRALEDNYGALISNNKKKNPALSTEGFLNLLFLTVAGKFPAKNGEWTYNEVDYSIDASKQVDSKSILIENPWSRKSPSDKLVQIYPNREGAVKTDAYTYAVPKGYHAGVGESGSNKYGTDVYAITWFDIAVAASSSQIRGESKSKKDSNNTVVGEQVDNWFYGALTGLLSVLGIRNADELVFGEWGNLFKNNTYEIFLAVQAPFVVLGGMMLLLAIYDAVRKSSKEYLSVGDVRTIESVFGRCVNAIIMIAILDVVVFVAIFANKILVDFAAQTSHYMKNMNSVPKGGGSLGGLQSVFEGIFGFFNITSIFVMIAVTVLNIKFTWRYIARAISFGIYFVTAPLIFCLDALKGGGKLFELGPMSADVMKNIIGLIFQQGMDALGIAFALNIGKIIFGNGMLVTILGFLSVEAVVNALMQTFGIRSGSIKGIEEAGMRVQKGAAAFGGALASSAAMKGIAAVKNGRNRDDEKILRDKVEQSANKQTASDGTSKSNVTKDFNMEAQKNAAKKRKQEENNQLNKSKENGLDKIDEKPINVNGSPILSTGKVDGLDSEQEKADEAWAFVDGDKKPEFQNDKKGSIGSDKQMGRFSKAGAGGLSAFLEGATSRGIYGDKDTKSGKKGIRGDNLDKNLNHRNYEIGDDGKVHAKNFAGKMSRFGRDAARFAGGAVLGSVLDPKYAARAVTGAIAQGVSAMTPTMFDDAVAASMNAKNLEAAMTGKTTGSTLGALATSLPGRFLYGAKGASFDVDAITADKVAGTQNAGVRVADFNGKGKGGNPFNEYSTEVKDSNTDKVLFRTGGDSGVDDKQFRRMHEIAQELRRMEDNPYNTTSYSREQLVNMTNDSVRSDSAQQMLDYMDKNGYESVNFNGDEVSYDRTYTRNLSDKPLDLDDPNAWAIKKQLETSPQAYDEPTGILFKQGTQDNQIYAFTPENPNTGATARALKQREMDLKAINANRQLSKEQKLDLIKDVYSSTGNQYFDNREKFNLEDRISGNPTPPPVPPTGGGGTPPTTPPPVPPTGGGGTPPTTPPPVPPTGGGGTLPTTPPPVPPTGGGGTPPTTPPPVPPTGGGGTLPTTPPPVPPTGGGGTPPTTPPQFGSFDPYPSKSISSTGEKKVITTPPSEGFKETQISSKPITESPKVEKTTFVPKDDFKKTETFSPISELNNSRKTLDLSGKK